MSHLTAPASQRAAEVRARPALFDWLAVASGLAMLLALYLALGYAPTDRVQGVAQRIYYVHVPLAWIAYLAFVIVAAASALYLWRRAERWDCLARASAEVGVVYTTLVLVTGSLWGKPIWGTWWTWDARLTTTLVLWFIYVGYLMLRAYTADLPQGPRYAAVLGILGIIDIPIVHQSVVWWRGLHPEAVAARLSGPAMPPEMQVALVAGLVAFTLLFALLLVQRYRVEVARRTIDALRAAHGEE
ncbi:MAG: cytochrome c biogenesis protein CcsA [Chloroflexi bacterium]|nr:cytochrome c biogenesis protein CcsA [Chloroflexota bacterium]